FDFAGYSLFAIAFSYIYGIQTPPNFKQPFKAKNIKDFWNRWHMSLSFWFRDCIYMRSLFFMSKKKLLKNQFAMSNVAFFLNFLIMGIWHGRSEEHTSELQSRFDLVCRLLLEKKKKQTKDIITYQIM